MMYYDDNFGAYEDMDDPDNVRFYFETQKKSRWKKCVICKRRVKLLPDYDKCNSCTEKIERGLLG